jgi:glycosyltransferase involved in cell wall biosynthesis
MTAPLRILLVTETLVAGGAETFVLRLARQLRALGHRADVLNLNRDLVEPDLVDQYRDIPIHEIPLPVIRWIKRGDRIAHRLGRDASLQRLLTARWIERHLLGQYDVYHSHLVNADWLMATLKRDYPAIRLVSTLHGDYQLHELRQASISERSRIAHWPVRRDALMRAIDRWVYIAEGQRTMFVDRLGVAAERLVRIYNGYAPPAELPEPQERPADAPLTFAMVARALPEKGWSLLIEAFGRLEGSCRLLLIGSGAYLDELKAQHADDARIIFAGFHANPAALLVDADVFVFPSTYPAESLPTVIIEALYCGIPAIATDIGEVAAMLETPSGERAGVVVPITSRAPIVDALAAAMQRYLDDPAQLAADRVRASAAFAKFDMAQCGRAYEAVYRSLVEG